MPEDQTKTPTAETYDAFQFAYDFYNRELFGDSLPNCVIIMMRKKGMLGYFSGNRWEDVEDQERADEICLNPQAFNTRPVDDTLSTLVHEMCHAWQHHFGHRPSKNVKYHNKEWAERMQEVGLMPTSTGLPGGKTTGQKMDHMIIKGGEFARVTEELLTNEKWLLPYVSIDLDEKAKKTKSQSKTKFTCPDCGENIWGKPSITAICQVCSVLFEADEPEDKFEKIDDGTSEAYVG